MSKFLKILFIVTAVLTMLEYYFICGLFTGMIMLAAIVIIGTANCVYTLIQKSYNEAALYAIATISMFLGYLKLM